MPGRAALGFAASEMLATGGVRTVERGSYGKWKLQTPGVKMFRGMDFEIDLFILDDGPLWESTGLLFSFLILLRARAN